MLYNSFPFLVHSGPVLFGPSQLHGLEFVSDTEINTAITGSMHKYRIKQNARKYK
jgi:hypothetical protein